MQDHQDHWTSAEAIREQKARYCRFVDTKQWDHFAKLFASDVRVRIKGADGELIASFDDAEAFVEKTSSFLVGASSIHQVHNSELTFHPDGIVSAIWSMEDYIVGLAPEVGFHTLHGYGHYHETWQHLDGRWAIASLELRRTILETQGD